MRMVKNNEEDCYSRASMRGDERDVGEMGGDEERLGDLGEMEKDEEVRVFEIFKFSAPAWGRASKVT